MPDSPMQEVESSFQEQVAQFADDIRRLLNAVFGGDQEITVTHTESKSRIVAQTYASPSQASIWRDSKLTSGAAWIRVTSTLP